jgi:hypothetical protein
MAAPSSIWKLTDTDGDGTPIGARNGIRRDLTGCATIHGRISVPTADSFDLAGVVVDRERVGSRRSRRARPKIKADGCDPTIEVVAAGGSGKPVDVAFTPSGERSEQDFLEHPQAGRRDALVHAVYGG